MGGNIGQCYPPPHPGGMVGVVEARCGGCVLSIGGA